MFLQDNYFPLKEAAERISSHDQLAEELLHYTIDEFVSKPNAEEIVLSGGAKFYCVRIMLNSWKSSSSPFYFSYRKHTESIDGIEAQDDEIEDLDHLVLTTRTELAKLPWYDRLLFETFLNEGHTVSSLSRVTGIPRTSVSLTLNRVRKHIKRNL